MAIIGDIPKIAGLTQKEFERKLQDKIRSILEHYDGAKLSLNLREKLSEELALNIVDDLTGRDSGPGAVLD